MFLQTKIEVYDKAAEDMGIEPEVLITDMVVDLSYIIGVRELVSDGHIDRTKAIVILRGGEEFHIHTPYSQVVSKLCPPQQITEE